MITLSDLFPSTHIQGDAARGNPIHLREYRDLMIVLQCTDSGISRNPSVNKSLRNVRGEVLSNGSQTANRAESYTEECDASQKSRREGSCPGLSMDS